jgi:hypothetical protein
MTHGNKSTKEIPQEEQEARAVDTVEGELPTNQEADYDMESGVKLLNSDGGSSLSLYCFPSSLSTAF